MSKERIGGRYIAPKDGGIAARVEPMLGGQPNAQHHSYGRALKPLASQKLASASTKKKDSK